jgi:hypothetical protein
MHGFAIAYMAAWLSEKRVTLASGCCSAAWQAIVMACNSA